MLENEPIIPDVKERQGTIARSGLIAHYSLFTAEGMHYKSHHLDGMALVVESACVSVLGEFVEQRIQKVQSQQNPVPPDLKPL